jgi:hypothetical protein
MKQIEGYVIQLHIWVRLRYYQCEQWSAYLPQVLKFTTVWKKEYNESHFQHHVCCGSTVKPQFFLHTWGENIN